MRSGNNALRSAFRFLSSREISFGKLIPLIADCLSIFGVVATIFGVSTSVMGHNFSGASFSFSVFGASSQGVSVADVPLAVRLIFILLICSSIGWAFGTISKRLTAHPSESFHFISNICAVFFALVLVASTELFANKESTGILPEFQFFTLIGLAIVLLICRFQYRVGPNAGPSIIVTNRSSGILTFVLATLTLMLLLELG